MKKFFSEPFVHFFLLGVVLVFVDIYWVGDNEEELDQILIDVGDLEKIEGTWRRSWGRAPTAEERSILMEGYIRDEVLYRTARKMGLADDDSIIRRRLVQKLEFLSEDVMVSRLPTDSELLSLYAKNPKKYEIPASITFTQFYFSSSKRGSNLMKDVRRDLAHLRRSERKANALEVVGDTSVLSASYNRASSNAVIVDFGIAFYNAIMEIPIGEWSGPVKSEVGVHLVKVIERLPATAPEFSTIKEALSNEFMQAGRKEANDAFYQEMRSKYEVIFDEKVLDELGR